MPTGKIFSLFRQSGGLRLTKESVSAVSSPVVPKGKHAGTIIALRKMAAVSRKKRPAELRAQAKKLRDEGISQVKPTVPPPPGRVDPPYIFNAPTVLSVTEETMKFFQDKGAQKVLFGKGKDDSPGVYIATKDSQGATKVKRAGRFIFEIDKPISTKSEQVKAEIKDDEMIVHVELPVLRSSVLRNPATTNQGELNYKVRLTRSIKKEA